MKTYENLRGKRVDVRGRQVRANKILFPSLLARLSHSLPSSPFPFSGAVSLSVSLVQTLWIRVSLFVSRISIRMEKREKEREEQSWEKFSISNDLRNELAERKKRDNAGIVCISIGGQLPPGRDVNRLQEPAGK